MNSQKHTVICPHCEVENEHTIPSGQKYPTPGHRHCRDYVVSKTYEKTRYDCPGYWLSPNGTATKASKNTMNWYLDQTDGVHKRVKGSEVAHKRGEFYSCMEQITEEPFVPEKFWAECDVDKVECFEEPIDQCICSKHIQQLCILIHRPTQKRIQVGCVCVKKDCSKELKKAINLGIKQAKSGDQLCPGCNKYCLPVDAPTYQTVCKPCYKIGTGHRQCRSCHYWCINKYDPNWKIRCIRCYYAK